MATMDETLKNIRNFINDVKEVYPDVVVEAAENAASLIVVRIGETGIASDGSQFGEYTDGVYKNKRAEIGHPIGFVNLRFTGEMLKDVKVLETKIAGGVTTTKVGARFKENDDKLFYNSIRYNDDILAVTDSEEKEIGEILDDGLQALVDINFK